MEERSLTRIKTLYSSAQLRSTDLNFNSDSCIVFLKNIAPGPDNYVSIELDNQYKGRIKIDSRAPKAYTIKATTKSSSHLLRIYKATESHNGVVILTGVKGTGITAADHPVKKKIEFIGNSITAAMAADLTEIPCGNGKWYDQHNAYYSYASRVGRAVNADFLLSTVSGIGIYRNWNSLLQPCLRFMNQPGWKSIVHNAGISPVYT